MANARTAVSWLFIGAVLTIDFSPLHVYRYFLLSDLLLLTAVAVQIWIDRQPTIYLPKLITALFALYLFSGSIAFLRATNPGLGLTTWLHAAFLMLIYVPAVSTLLVLRPDLRRPGVVALFWTVAFQAAVLAWSVIEGLHWQTGTRITNIFGSAQLWIYAAAFLAGLALLVLADRHARANIAGGLGLLCLAEILLRARMIWVASAFGACGFLLMQARTVVRGLAAVAAVCVMAFAGYALDLYPAAMSARIAAVLRPSESSDLVARVQVARDVLDEVEASPLVGIGTGQSAGYLGALPEPPTIVNAHNILLHASFEAGIVAAIALCLLPLGFVVLWREACQRSKQREDRVLANWACASLLAIFVGSQLTPTLYEHTVFFIVGFLASLAAMPVAAGLTVERIPRVQRTATSPF